MMSKHEYLQRLRQMCILYRVLRDEHIGRSQKGDQLRIYRRDIRRLRDRYLSGV